MNAMQRVYDIGRKTGEESVTESRLMSIPIPPCEEIMQ